MIVMVPLVFVALRMPLTKLSKGNVERYRKFGDFRMCKDSTVILLKGATKNIVIYIVCLFVNQIYTVVVSHCMFNSIEVSYALANVKFSVQLKRLRKGLKL